MNIRYVSLCLAALLVFMIGNGCGKSESTKSVAPPLPLSKDTVARVHWLGKKRLGVEASAYYLMRIWQLPASKQLENQTLDKLGLARPLFSAQPASPNTQLEAMLMRQMLTAVLHEECYFSIRQSAGKPPEMVFAIRLSNIQDGYWKTNLGMLAQSLTGITAIPMDGRANGWTIKKHDAPNLVEALRDGDWSFVGIAQDRNTLLEETIARTRQYHDPFILQSTNNWLEADLDLSRVNEAFGLKSTFPTNAPFISLAITGDGGNVLTRANLTFPDPLRIVTSPWNVPTNLIREPLTSFTAMRGIEPAIATSKLWADFSTFAGRSNSPPNEFYFWSQWGLFQTSFAAPLMDASGRIRDLTDQVITKANPWLATHKYVSFERMPDSSGFTWGKLSTVKPFLTSKEIGGRDFLFGGLLADVDYTTNAPMRPGLLGEFTSQTNLVYFDWELTGQRVDAWLYISQMTRSLLHRPQLPMDSAGANWMGTIKQRLGESKTEIAQTGPNQLSFTRKSTIGLTAPELHLLVDWLESPQFPADY